MKEKILAFWRKEADAEITKANKTHETGLRQKYDFTKKKQEPANPAQTEPGTGGTVDAAAIQKLITDNNTENYGKSKEA